MADDIKNTVEYEDPELKEPILGKMLVHAPQPALPAVTAHTPFAAGALSATGATVLNDLEAKQNAIEAVLIKLGFLKHR